MALQLSSRDQLDAELRHRYLKLCNRFGRASVEPPRKELVDAFANVVAAAEVRGPGAVVAAVQTAGESYEFIVGRWCDTTWRSMVGMAIEKGRADDSPEIGQDHSGGYFGGELPMQEAM
jgi:hypothetical protein